jgi:putative intracellular protease/amidase
MIVTSHDRMGQSGRPTGLWFEELAAPYLEFADAGWRVDIASPDGGPAPIDPKSLEEPPPAVSRFRADRRAVLKAENTIRLRDVREAYDAYFVVGGHGVMWDLPDDPLLPRLLADAFEDGRIVAAVCHGPAALVNATLSSGEPLVRGRRVTAFTDEEERLVQLDGVVPFPLETTLRERGARFESGPAWQPYATRDGRLITGQNPNSSAQVAREVMATAGAGGDAPTGARSAR